MEPRRARRKIPEDTAETRREREAIDLQCALDELRDRAAELVGEGGLPGALSSTAPKYHLETIKGPRLAALLLAIELIEVAASPNPKEKQLGIVRRLFAALSAEEAGAESGREKL